MLVVAYPLLQRIGLMWLAGTVNPAQEHLLAHLLRQKMLAATDALPPVPSHGPALGAVFARGRAARAGAAVYELRRCGLRGQHTLYLGQNLPTAELAAVCQAYQPDAAGYGADPAARAQPGGGICRRKFRPCASDKLLVLYGPLARQEGLELPPNCVAPALMTDFLALVGSLETEPVAA